MYLAALPGEAEARLFSWQEQMFLTLLLVTHLEQIITAVSRCAHIQRGTMVRSMEEDGNYFRETIPTTTTSRW